MTKHLIVAIVVLLLSVGLSGCVETNRNGSIPPSNEDQDKEEFTTLPDGTKVHGDIDKLEILNYSIVTEKEVNYRDYQKIADGFVYSEDASRYRIYGTAKNIAGKMLPEGTWFTNNIKITVKFYDNNEVHLVSKTTTKYTELPDTYTWDFEITYSKDDYFEYVDHISFEISVS